MTSFSDDRRRYVRVIGPFDGVRPGLCDMPVQIYDLSVGGCFVNSVHQAPHRGQIFAIHVGLPTGETIVAKGETAFVRPGFGYGVKFCELSEDNRKRLETALESMQQSATVAQR